MLYQTLEHSNTNPLAMSDNINFACRRFGGEILNVVGDVLGIHLSIAKRSFWNGHIAYIISVAKISGYSALLDHLARNIVVRRTHKLEEASHKGP